MSNRRNRQRQSSAAGRQASIGGRQDTSQTTGGGRFVNTDSTYATDAAAADEEFAVGGRGQGYKPRSDVWTVLGTIAAWLGIVGSLVAVLLWVGWQVSKADTALTTVQGDVGDVKKKVDNLTGESAKHAGRLDRIEGAVGRIESSIRNLRSEKRGDK